MRESVTPELIASFERIVMTLRELVDHPDEVVCRTSFGSENCIVHLETHVDDVPFVLGRQGHVIVSIRSLLSARAGRNKVSVNLDYPTQYLRRGSERGNERGGDRDEARGNRGRFDDR